MEKVKLNILGISYSPVKQGAYAMVLAEEDGPYRLPIVIGSAEAQSIAIKLEGIVTPRPITHELFCTFAHAFGVELEEVFIYNFEDGIFSSELTFTDGVKEVMIDARTSDAIAIAVRTGAPIYTTREILTQAGAIWENDKDAAEARPDIKSTMSATPKEKSYSDMSDDELSETLERLIGNEDYEEAARVSEIIKKRKEKQ